MYRRQAPGQMKLDMPFNVKLNKNSKWVKMADIFPWEYIEEVYTQSFENEKDGAPAYPARLAFAAVYIYTSEDLTDRKVVTYIQENPHMQYFCGFDMYEPREPFDYSMMHHFRKRFPAEIVMKINEFVFLNESISEQDTPQTEIDDDIEVPATVESCEALESTEKVEDAGNGEETKCNEENIDIKPNRGTLILDATCCPQNIKYPTDIGLL